MGEFSFIGVAALLARGHAGLVEGVTQAAEDFTGKAQAAAPVDTGTLRASIHVESIESSGTSVTATVATGGEAAYAVFVEMGTHKMAAQPYMGPTLIENRAVYEEVMSRAIRGAF